MKTLADLKRDLVIGSSLILLSRYGKTEGKNIGVERFVVKKNTAGVYLGTNKTAKTGAFLDWPKASLLEYADGIIKMYVSGLRPLTEEEKNIIVNQPRDEKQEKIDRMSDVSTMFYRRKAYFQQVDREYLFTSYKKQSGKQIKYGTKQTADDGSFSDWFISDDNVKGESGLVYQVN